MALIAVAAEPIDMALDLAQRVSTPIDSARDALHVMALWHLVFDGAMRGNDVPLAVLAAREWRNARRAAQLIGSLAPP